MSIGEGGRISASSSGRGSLGSVDGQRQRSSRRRTPQKSGAELFRENVTARKPCDETCGFNQLQCANCTSHAVLSVQRIGGKIEQVWSIVNETTNPRQRRDHLGWNIELADVSVPTHTPNYDTLGGVGSVSTLSSRQGLVVVHSKDSLASSNATAPPLSRPQSSDSGLFDLSEGKPVPFENKKSTLSDISKYSYTLSQSRRGGSSAKNAARMTKSNGSAESATSRTPSDEHAVTNESLHPRSPVDADEAVSYDSGSSNNEFRTTELVPVAEEAEEEPREVAQPSHSEKKRRTEPGTNPFEDNYKEPKTVRPNGENSEPCTPHSANPFEEGEDDDDPNNPFNTTSSASSVAEATSASESLKTTKKSRYSPPTRPSSSILDVKKLLNTDKVHPAGNAERIIITRHKHDEFSYDPEIQIATPSQESSADRSTSSKCVVLCKQVSIGIAVVIMVGVIVMFLASLGKSIMR